MQRLAQDSDAAPESARCAYLRNSLLALTVCTRLPLFVYRLRRYLLMWVFFRPEWLDQLAAKKLAVEERAAEQAETASLTKAKATKSLRATTFSGRSSSTKELRVVKAVSECQ